MDAQRCRRIAAIVRKVCLVGMVAAPASAYCDGTSGHFRVVPAAVELSGNFAQAQLLVRTIDGSSPAEQADDLTSAAAYMSSNPHVVEITATGRLIAKSDGLADITVEHAGHTQQVRVTVAGVVPDPTVDFTRQVVPILSKAGCNAGACHASQFGKGGFKLSVFGYSPADDYESIARARFIRRVNLMEPEQSLLLLKPTRVIPHGGNRRIEPGSVDYQILLAWLRGGAPPPTGKEPQVTGLRVAPERRVGPEGFKQQLQVQATYSDGSSRDVTAWAKYDSMDEGIVQVARDGLVKNIARGQAAVMVRFEGQAQLATMVCAYRPAVELTGWENNNYVDELAVAKFKELGITPSPLCDDATFLRRVYLDSIGTLPTVEETSAFLDSARPDKRTALVDQLLGLSEGGAVDHRNHYAAYWAVKWADLIRSSSRVIGERGMWALHNWLNESFRANKPFDKFVSELVTAKGSIYSNGPANYFRIANNPQDLAEATSQLFLGVRLQCAKCHHHPYEKYSQADYYSFAACFAGVSLKNSQEFGLFGGEQVVVVKKADGMQHPKTGELLPPTPLESKPLEPTLDRRKPLARWLVAPENRFFARNVVNRYVAYLFGRGLVEPVDDLRATNPATNVALMDRLSREFAAGGFDLKKLMRDLMVSRLYQLDSQPLPSNATDDRFYSHYRVKRISAEPLSDAIDQVTGVPTKFENMPLGTRAIELPDSEYKDYFLRTFGKPRRASVCECERVSTPNLSQALNTLNGSPLAAKISDSRGRIGRLLEQGATDEKIMTDLYLAALCRRPSAEELAAGIKFRGMSPDSKTFAEDLMWSLINSKQFLFVR